MYYTKVTEDTFQLSDNLSRDKLFEGIWPIPNGVSINSFLVKGAEKYALIDGICTWNGKLDELEKILKNLGLSSDEIGYLIINHMEPDHSGWLESLYACNPKVEIYISQKGADVLKGFYRFCENVHVMKDGESLDIGNGHVFNFYEIPNVHWPDTMMTFDTKTGVAFSCDAFGSYGAVPENNYDDCLTEEELQHFEDEVVGYYSNIVASFTSPVKKALQKCATLPIKIICPGHGLVWRKDPARIVKLYEQMSSYQTSPDRNEVTLIWGSMYGMTERAVKVALEALEKSGVKYHVHKVPETDIGIILKSCWTSKGIILGMPTYEYNMFPPMATVLDELGRKKVAERKCFRFGSFGWSGGAEKELQEIMERRKMKWEFLPSVEFKGAPTESDLNIVTERIGDLVSMVSASIRGVENE